MSSGKGTSKKDPYRFYIPPEGILALVLPLTCILGSLALTITAWLKGAEPDTLFRCGVAVGLIGILLLFVARLPLYRQHRFWAIGPRLLDRKNRWFYWIAYAFVGASLLLLWVVNLRT